MATCQYFEELGGASPLRAIIHDFVGRVCDDVMIGFFFSKVDRARLEDMEYLFAAQFLGADVTYSGRPLRAAHASHPIMGGQFGRRKQILKETLIDHTVDQDIINAWLDHTESLRALITGDSGTECDEKKATERLHFRTLEQINDD